ncbi:hypothetical protein ACFRQM_35660 [Streptomyces sp. NPDC056831]|uniref:hypothetical protein n=1 Tax=Streptomyces sp. NPDC056831 TaxID=3345954 RepID=UPI003694DBF6
MWPRRSRGRAEPGSGWRAGRCRAPTPVVLGQGAALVRLGVSDVAALAGSAPPSVVRACQRLGFRGHQELEIAAARQGPTRAPAPDPHDDPAARALADTIHASRSPRQPRHHADRRPAARRGHRAERRSPHHGRRRRLPPACPRVCRRRPCRLPHRSTRRCPTAPGRRVLDHPPRRRHPAAPSTPLAAPAMQGSRSSASPATHSRP